MTITKIPLDRLQLNPKNVRIHSEKQLNEYKRSVKKFGQTKPIVCDENYVILIGNGLYQAMTALGLKEADCYVRKDLTEKEKLKLMMADNKVYELGITDMSTLDEIVASLGDDLDIPGYDDELLQMLQMSTREATELALEYGKVEASAAKEEPPAEYRTSQELGEENPYADAHDPQRAQHAEAENTRRYVLCPKCGERIWL